jgi:hypothetical protein
VWYDCITISDATNTYKGEYKMDEILNTLVDGEELTKKHQEKLLAIINSVKHGGFQHENQNKYS